MSNVKVDGNVLFGFISLKKRNNNKYIFKIFFYFSIYKQ
jgi:hypothetical protein